MRYFLGKILQVSTKWVDYFPQKRRKRIKIIFTQTWRKVFWVTALINDEVASDKTSYDDEK